MTISATVAAMALVAVVGQNGTGESTTPVESAEKAHAVVNAASETAAREWLALFANAEPEVSWQDATAGFRNRYPEGLWEMGVRLGRNNLGEVLQRDLRSVERRPIQIGQKARAVEVLTFDTDFARTSGVVEKLVMHRIDGRWRVADFDVTLPDECTESAD
ncbi:MAG: DUF4019 domain-containing protein [Alteraurantiacibacter sp.]